MLVHAPIACWILTPACDGLAIGFDEPAFWTVAAFLSAAGVLLGALAATAGSLDFARGYEAAPKIMVAHATLMASAWTLSALSAFGRFSPDYAALTPPHMWAIGASAIAFVAMVGGAWCGGELVYGRGVGVRRD
jgi:uncharacterized membrane protein